jgi:hypothetical protein
VRIPPDDRVKVGNGIEKVFDDQESLRLELRHVLGDETAHRLSIWDERGLASHLVLTSGLKTYHMVGAWIAPACARSCPTA